MNNLHSVINIIKQLTSIMTTKQKKGSFVVGTSMLILAGLELLGVSAIYPFLQVMMNSDTVRSKWYARWIFQIWPELSAKEVVMALGCGLIVIYLIKNAFALVCNYVQYRFAAQFNRELSKSMLESYMARPYEFFVNANSGDLIRGIMYDTSSVYILLVYILQICAESFTILMIGIYLLFTDWFITVCALVLALVCFLSILLGFRKKMKRTGKLYRDAAGEQNKYCLQAINGIKEISVMDRRQCFVDQFDKASRKLARAKITNDVVTSCPDRILEGVCIGGIIGIVCVRYGMGTDDTDTFLPVMGAFAMAAFKILPSISKVSSRITGIIYYIPALNNCYETIQEARRLEQLDKENARKNAVGDYENWRKGEQKFFFNEKLTLRNIRWQYANAKDPVINGLSLTIRKGESVGFVGASGAGKSTLSDIILGLFAPQEGTVEMDGVDIFTIPHDWAHIVGYVPQTVYLTDDTIRANVAFGLPQAEVSDEKIWKALEQAQIASFVKELPNGLDTIVGERGVRFSGGQRQRIAIARALYENPDILVLDEATSALDNDTEAAVMEAIESLQGRKTLIIVAHRLSTIQNCDTVYEIGNGVAVLKEKRGFF